MNILFLWFIFLVINFNNRFMKIWQYEDMDQLIYYYIDKIY